MSNSEFVSEERKCPHGFYLSQWCPKCIRTEVNGDQITVRAHSPLDIQIGGDHYKSFAIQPIEYTIKNKLNFVQGNVVKYITRYNMPTGKGIEDLKKIKHYIDILIAMEGVDNG